MKVISLVNQTLTAESVAIDGLYCDSISFRSNLERWNPVQIQMNIQITMKFEQIIKVRKNGVS